MMSRLDLTFKWLVALLLGKKRVNIYQELSLVVMSRAVSETFIDESVHDWGLTTAYRFHIGRYL
jgi:hypothetical protein